MVSTFMNWISWICLQKLKVEKAGDEKKDEEVTATAMEKVAHNSAPPEGGMVVDSC